MRRHAWVWAALAWVAVVVVVSTVTWAVIDSAGRNVLAQQGGGTGRPASSDRPQDPTPTPRDGEPGVTLAPTARGPTATQSASPPPASMTPPAPTAPPPSPSGVTRTWQGTAGTVTVRCVGGRINLQSASPGNGWRVEVDEQGPEEVEVELTTEGEGDEEDEREVHVGARCVGGTPSFEVEQD